MDEIFNSSVIFKDLGLRDSVLKGVEDAGFVHPTHIQETLIPAVLAGRDVLGQAKTGTGKTAAFGLPILDQADKDTPMQALILTPTRELAAQVATELSELGRFTSIRTACIIGGESMRQQAEAVKSGAHLLVGTPGRVMDMHGRKQIHFHNIRFAVLDEVDRMLDIGFRDDIRKILGSVPAKRQTIFVSATISGEIDKLGRQFMKKDAQRIDSVSSSLTVSLVKQCYLPVEPWDKDKLLLCLLRREEPETALVFCRTKATVHRLTRYLRDHRIDCREIHGDLVQQRRNRVMDSLRRGNIDVLVASDLAARGLDVDHITHVVNYDLPEDPELYVHRIGRTARAGRGGVAWSFVTPEQGILLTEIEKYAGVLIEKLEYDDFRPGPVPTHVQEQRSRDDRRRSEPTESLRERVEKSTELDGLSSEQREMMFPGGVVPKDAPKRTLGSKFRSRRSR